MGVFVILHCMASSFEFLLDPYQQQLDALNQASRLRRCRITENGTEAVASFDGHPIVNFSSNNYLGLAQDTRLKDVAKTAVEEYGTGAGASRLISGTSSMITELEETVARFKRAESALVFNSGYQANVAILQAVLNTGDYVFSDRLNHASLIDGCLLSGAKWSRYRHLDLEHLEKKLQQAPRDAKKWVVTDSLFSMDGDYGNLKALLELTERYGALLLIDEAHATGLYGEVRSSGLCEVFGISDRVALQMGTFSKALGGFGAYVAGPDVLMKTLVNKARGFVYSTALPPAVIAAARHAIELVQSDPSMKIRLWKNVRKLHHALQTAGIPFESRTQIVPVVVGEAKQAVDLSERLLEEGYYVQAIRPPTVPEGTARLRIAVSALHTEDQMNGLVTALKKHFA